MSPTTIQIITSAVRWLIAYAVGALGFTIADAELGNITTAIITIVLFVLSLWWSKKSDTSVKAETVAKVSESTGASLHDTARAAGVPIAAATKAMDKVTGSGSSV